MKDDEEASITLWDGGCKMKRISTTVNPAKIAEPEVATTPRRKNVKNFTPVRKTGMLDIPSIVEHRD